MAENKHSEISKTLEKAIRSGKYFERIPPVRTLAREFGVSLQTMSKALKTLQRDGLLISGPGGTRIVEKIPYNYSGGVVAVFTSAEYIMQRDPLWLSLQEEAAQDNTSLVTMLAGNKELFSKHSFWEKIQCDGCIFLYSSFYPLAGELLHLSCIPFVVGNWLPPEFKAHWVDFDWKKRLFELVGLMYEQSYRKIAYLPNLHWKFGCDFHIDMWKDVCTSYNIVNYTPGARSLGIDCAANLEHILCSKHGEPEVIILHNSDIEVVWKIIDKFNYRGKVLLSDSFQSVRNDPRVIFYQQYDYKILGKKIWQVFKQIAEGKIGSRFEHLVALEQAVLL